MGQQDRVQNGSRVEFGIRSGPLRHRAIDRSILVAIVRIGPWEELPSVPFSCDVHSREIDLSVDLNKNGLLAARGTPMGPDEALGGQALGDRPGLRIGTG